MEQSKEVFSVFTWNTNFELGIQSIDNQHKKIVELINRLAIMSVQGCQSESLNTILDEIVDYTDYHFNDEEKIWTRELIDDSLVLDHQKTHNEFISTVLQVREELKLIDSENSIEQILKILIGWLTNHILDNDKFMALVINFQKKGNQIDHAKSLAEKFLINSHVLTKTIMEMYQSLTIRSLHLFQEREKAKLLTLQLQESEQNEKIFSESLIKSINGLLFTLDDHFNIIRWNDGFKLILGFDDSELKNRNLLTLIEDEPAYTVDSCLHRLKQSININCELRLRHAKGSIKTFIITGNAVLMNDKTFYTCIGIDISRQKDIEQKLEQHEYDLKTALMGTVTGVAKALESRDPYTAGHQERVADIAVQIARQMGLNETIIEGIRLGASIHDLGKISVPTEILTKPTHLSKAEYTIIQAHPQAGFDILSDIKFPWPIKEIVLQHHERIDGTGYPNGIKGDEIILEARIVAVADVYESMSTHRPYRQALEKEVVIKELQDNINIRYDANVVKALFKLIENNEL